MSTYDLFRRAALEGRPLAFTYQGHERLTCPHVVGLKNGMQKALVFQFGGGSSSGLPAAGQWRCLFLAEVTDVRLIAGEWKTSDSHSQPQTCVDQIDVQVFVGPEGSPYSKIA